MENTACQLEIERSEDRNVATRRRFVESIVLASHIGLRKQFQHMEIIKLYQHLQTAEDAWNRTKEKLKLVKNQERQLTLENTNLGSQRDLQSISASYKLQILEGQAGLIRNLPMLNDFKTTQDHMESVERKNKRSRKFLGFWFSP